jgi:hypothetical protein
LDLGSSQATICTWFNPASFVQPNQFIVARMNTVGTRTDYALVLVNSSAVGYGYDDPSTASEAITAWQVSQMNTGNWHYFCVVLNSSTMVIGYYDGAILGAATSSHNSQESSNVYLGDGITARYESISESNLYNFNGTLDELKIWNRSLSSDEIYEQYASNLQKFNSTQWYLQVNQSKNATAGLDLGTYTYKAYAIDFSGGANSTETRSVSIEQLDTTYPQFSSYWDNNASLVGSGTARFNVTLANTNGTVILTINGTNYTASNNSGSANVFNVTTTLSNAGVYNYTWKSYGNGTSANYNVSETRSYTVNATVADAIYPIFSSYSDNNGSLVNSGTARFNVTLANTNGTVWLEINGQNITATNNSGSSTRFNVTSTFSFGGTYSYKWHSWGNGTNHNYNVSNTQSYTVNGTSTCSYSSGNWSINIADNCIINNNNLGSNTLIIGGTCGTLTINGTVTAKQIYRTPSSFNGCFQILIKPGGMLLAKP